MQTLHRRPIAGVEDLHAELKAYNDAMVAGMTLDEAQVAARQQRTTAAELGLLPLDGLDETASLPHRIAFLNDLYDEVGGCESGWGRQEVDDECSTGGAAGHACCGLQGLLTTPYARA